MKIQFFNHACFSIENQNIVLLNDPYLSGTAFNNGWDLILDNINFKFDLSKKNYIYYSHEHPDHFSIQFLQSINEEDRKSITILYQKTKDGKVKNFVKKLGFNVIEVSDKEKYKLTDVQSNNFASMTILFFVSVFLCLGSMNPYSTVLQSLILIIFSISYFIIYKLLLKFKLYFKK